MSSANQPTSRPSKRGDRRKLNAVFECIVTERDGDRVWCEAHPLGEYANEPLEFWELDVPGNKWDEGIVFYVVLPVTERDDSDQVRGGGK